jgi:hypothetical protein
MDKLSSEKVAEVLKDAAACLRIVGDERDHYKKIAESLQLRGKVEKIASSMHHKGIDLDTPVEALADRLEKAAEQGKLDTIEAAVDMVAPDMGTKLAQLTNDEVRDTRGSSALETYVLGDVG